MTPTRMLYAAAGEPAVDGLLTTEQWQAFKPTKRPASYPPGGSCYLCGLPIEGAALPTSVRLKEETWTAHNTARAVRSEWLCAACAFSLSESATHPDFPKVFKVRCQTHYIHGETWHVMGLSDKLQMRVPLLNPPPEPWLMVMCDSPLSAGHSLYLTRINRPSAQDWTVMLGRVQVRGNSALLAELLAAVEALYAAEHSKTAIGSGNYTPKHIVAQGFDVWAQHEATLAPHRSTPLFEIALFLAQKGTEESESEA